MQTFAKAMTEAGLPGSIINLSSIVGKYGNIGEHCFFFVSISVNFNCHVRLVKALWLLMCYGSIPRLASEFFFVYLYKSEPVSRPCPHCDISPRNFSRKSVTH